MSILRKIFSDSVFTTIRSIVSIGRGLVVIPLITNLLGAGSYGVWVTVLAMIGLLGSAGEMHLHGALIRFSQQESKKNQTYSDILSFSFLIGILLFICTLIASTYADISVIFDNEVTNQHTLGVIAAVLLLSKIMFSININFPRSRGKVKLYDKIRLVKDVVEIVFLSIIFMLGGGIIAGLSTLAAIYVTINMIIMGVVFSQYSLPYPNVDNFTTYIKYGLPMVPKELSSSLLKNSDKYLILYFLGPAAVGIYNVAEKICTPLVNLTSIFNPTLYPTISQAWDEGDFLEIEKAYRSIFRYYSIIGIPSMFGIVILSEPLLIMVSTADIANEGAFLVPIFIVGYFLRGYDNPIRYILTSAERTGIIGGSVFLSVIINISMNIFLIPRFGMLGAASATLSSQIILFSVILYYSASEISLGMPWYSIGRALLSSSIMASILLGLGLELDIFMKLTVYPLLGIMIYFISLFAMGEFTRQEVNWITSNVLNIMD